MSIWRIIFANLKFSHRQHLGTCMGVALASMILVGALTVGDSIRATLFIKSQERIGSISHVFLSEEGYFHADLSDRLQEQLVEKNEKSFAPVLVTQGTISSPDGKIRASGITVLGIDERFFDFARKRETSVELSKLGFWASPDLAKELSTDPGSRMILRVEEPSLFSRDAPLSGERDARFISWNRTYLGELESASLGNFSLRASMEPVRTIFAPLSMLQEDMFIGFDPNGQRDDFANMLLVKAPKMQAEELRNALHNSWTLADGGLEIKKLRAESLWSLRSRSVFLGDQIIDKARQIEPTACAEFTYLVNAIRKPDESTNEWLTPYSMVCGVEREKTNLFPKGWTDNKIAVSQWLAEDLNLSMDDEIILEYYVVGKRRDLLEKNRSFRVGKILPLPAKISQGEESDWTPKFPGLSDSENCGEWDTGVPIKHDIRTKDEVYWDEYRGSPKAFISHRAAEDMWGNRWGSHTGLGISGSSNSQNLKTQLSKQLSPFDLGVRLIHLQKDAKRAVAGPVDFDQLFLAFGFFAVIAGIALSSLVFAFSLEQRNQQAGILLALGYRHARVRKIIWTEACLVCLVGSIMGMGWAWFFGRGILWMLERFWSGAVAQLEIIYAPLLSSVFSGLLASFLSSFLVLVWMSRKIYHNPPVQLIQGGRSPKPSAKSSLSTTPWWIKIQWIERIVWLLAASQLFFAWQMRLSMGPSFFGVGCLVLLAGLLKYWRILKAARTDHVGGRILLGRLESRPDRKILVVGMLAMGAFLVIGAGGFRQKLPDYPDKKNSETGGFSHILKTSLPIYDDLQGTNARDLFDLNPDLLKNISIIPIRTLDGDEANCLNLHHSNVPPLYGVPVAEIEDRFEFLEGNWSILEESSSEKVLPAAVDQNTMLWSMKKELGDRIHFIDGEGEKFEVEIASVLKGSFLQGGLYISENNWLKKYPARGGFRDFWIGGEESYLATDHLIDRLFNYGAQKQTTIARLGEFKKVENTYLSIFQALGGLGILLGTLGLWIVIVRNLWERSKELAILSAVGFSSNRLQRIFRKENIRVVYWGLLIGIGAGMIGLLPTLDRLEDKFSFLSVLSFGCGLITISHICLVWAVRMGIKGNFSHKLRDE